jgi:hypothetical protein
MTDSANKDCVQRHFGITGRSTKWTSSSLRNLEFRCTVLPRSGHHSADHSHVAQRFSGFGFSNRLAGRRRRRGHVRGHTNWHALGRFPPYPPLHGATLAPNGREFTVKHIHGFRLKEAKIVEHFAVRDDLACSSSLGISMPSVNSCRYAGDERRRPPGGPRNGREECAARRQTYWLITSAESPGMRESPCMLTGSLAMPAASAPGKSSSRWLGPRSVPHH